MWFRYNTMELAGSAYLLKRCLWSTLCADRHGLFAENYIFCPGGGLASSPSAQTAGALWFFSAFCIHIRIICDASGLARGVCLFHSIGESSAPPLAIFWFIEEPVAAEGPKTSGYRGWFRRYYP